MRGLLKHVPLSGFLAGALIAIGLCQSIAAQEKSQADSSAQTTTAPKSSEAPAAPEVKSPICGSSTVQLLSSATQHHKVILVWKASPRAASPEYDAVGYCVYRSTKQGDDSPELINSTPFTGTGCTDDLVTDDRTYYYVVRAISSKGRKSPLSNEALALIPPEGQAAKPVATGSFPSCRAVSTP